MTKRRGEFTTPYPPIPSEDDKTKGRVHNSIPPIPSSQLLFFKAAPSSICPQNKTTSFTHTLILPTTLKIESKNIKGRYSQIQKISFPYKNGRALQVKMPKICFCVSLSKFGTIIYIFRRKVCRKRA
jgi:hypothetical protein